MRTRRHRRRGPNNAPRTLAAKRFRGRNPRTVNMLRGEMSIVGPRPERPQFAARFRDHVYCYDDRLGVKSGITGWAQVNALRLQTSIVERVESDNS